MENKKYETLDEFLGRNLKEEETNIVNNGQNKKRKLKGLILSGILFLVALATAFTCYMFTKKKKNNNDTNNNTYDVVSVDNVSIDDIGTEDETLKEEKNEYGNTTGNVDKTQIVEDSNGTIWVNEEAAKKADEVGKVVIDDQGGTLEVKPNGDVYVKEEGYEVTDEKGNVVQSGTNESGIPEGYAWDSVLNKYVKEDQVGKFVYSDNTYYGPDGVVVYEKGEIVSKESLEKAKQLLTTTKPNNNVVESTKAPVVTQAPSSTKAPVATQTPSSTKAPVVIPTPTPVPTTSVEETQITTDEGVINEDGTYTIYGETYKSKADFQQFILYPEQYGYYNGIIMSIEDIEALSNSNQKTLTK